MKSLIGIDLNGIRDALARREEADEPDETDETESIDLGTRGGFIRLETHEGRWLAGVQTEAAPHGRGAGWGRIGSADKRLHILETLEAIRGAEPDDKTREAFASALPDLVGNSDLAVFAVPDIPIYGETFRDRYLRLLRRVDGLRPLLLWRPVAAVLGWVDTHPAEAVPGCNVAVLSLMANGVHLSVLSLEEEDDRGVRLLVPERRKPGWLVGASFRGETLVKEAQSRFARTSDLPAELIEAATMSPWRLAVGSETPPELARLSDNRGWRKLPHLDYPGSRPDEGDLTVDVQDALRTAEVLLVEGPFAGNVTWRSGVLEALKAHGWLPERVAPLNDKAVARGCLEAAKRYRDGQPIYFDFLPQLQINAMVGETPQFVDLIGRGARCRGGQSFRAEAPGQYAVDRGATRLTLWLFKEEFERGRKADISLPAKADQRYRLSISVEQVPGQGSAEVRISSPKFDVLRQSPITLDWAIMKETDQTREEILKDLHDQSQSGRSWPDTRVTPGHPYLWSKGHPKGALVVQLAAYRNTPLLRHARIHTDTRERLRKLRERFSETASGSFLGRKLGIEVAQTGSFRALDSDGSLPEPMDGLGVPDDAEAVLDGALSNLEKDLAGLQHLFGQRIWKQVLGDMLGFASWCFWRCPAGIADVFLGTYDGVYSYDINHNLLCEGVARVVHEKDQLRRYFKALDQRLTDRSRMTTAEYAGLARVLGTSDEAAVILNGALADRILAETVKAFVDENNKDIQTAYKKRFKTALLMVAVLLRHRKAHPAFLDPDEDNDARRLLATLDEAKVRNLDFATRIERSAAPDYGAKSALRRRAAAMRNHAEIIAELRDFIHREGRDPNIIRRIDALEEEPPSADGDDAGMGNRGLY